jgi:hypothetical protein
MNPWIGKQIEINTEEIILPQGFDTVASAAEFAELQAKRKEEGRCVHCGELLPISAMGLLDCKVCAP